MDGYSTFTHVDFTETEFLPTKVDSPISGGINIDEFRENDTITFFNITGLVSSKDAVWEADSKIVVKNGLIKCIGPRCEQAGTLIDLQMGWVIPGLIAASGHLGMEEIAAESSTSAGDIYGDVASAADGLQIGLKYSKELRAAFKAGFTTAVSQLRYEGPIGSISVAFRVGHHVVEDDSFVLRQVAQHFTVGNSAKSSGKKSSSVPGQIAEIRSKIIQGVSAYSFNVESSSQMYPLLDIIPQHRDERQASSVIFYGASEAHAIASTIAKKGISIILANPRCVPESWYNRDCLVAGSSPSAYQKLKDAGVNVGIATKEDNLIRGLIWEAGWMVSDLQEHQKMNQFEFAKEVASLLTWNIAKALQLEDKVGSIRLGMKPNFVVYDGVPGTLSAKVRLVVDGEKIENDTDQF